MNYLSLKQLKPDLALLINTQHTKNKNLDKHLSTLLNAQSIQSEYAPQLALDDNYVQLLTFFNELKEHIQCQPWSEITLNITGGTKLMSLAAYQALNDICQQIIYVNTSKDQIQLFQRDDYIALKHDLIGVDEYLFAQGVYSVKKDIVDDKWLNKANSRRLLTEKLAEFSSKPSNGWFIGALNHQTSKAVTQNRTHNGEREFLLTDPNRKFKNVHYDAKKLLRECESFGLLTYDGNREIEILDIDSAQYLNGVWLEEYCYFLANEVGIHDVRCSQPILWQTDSQNAQRIENEIDVILVHNNRMLIIECKTGNFDRNDVSNNSNEIIYKLDSIASDFRGLYGSIWLISARKIKDKRILERAKSQGIRIIHGEELVNLKDELKKWARL